MATPATGADFFGRTQEWVTFGATRKQTTSAFPVFVVSARLTDEGYTSPPDGNRRVQFLSFFTRLDHL
ncbi:MAG: hypothetical protein WCL46_03005 [Chlorobium sp.]